MNWGYVSGTNRDIYQCNVLLFNYLTYRTLFIEHPVCVCVHTQKYTSVYAHPCVCRHQCVHTSVYAHISVCTPLCMHTSVCAHISVCTTLCMDTSVYTHICVFTHQCIHTSVYAHLRVCTHTCVPVRYQKWDANTKRHLIITTPPPWAPLFTYPKEVMSNLCSRQTLAIYCTAGCLTTTQNINIFYCSVSNNYMHQKYIVLQGV